MNRISFIFAFMVLAACNPIKEEDIAKGKPIVTEQHTALRTQWQDITAPFKGTVGIALVDLESGDTLTLHNAHHYTMHSVYKFPLAMAILQKADSGALDVDDVLFVDKDELRPETWSPLRDSFPTGTDITVGGLLQYSVSMSDNNACDILFRLAGGPGAVNNYVHNLGISDMAIATNEYEMTKGWDIQYTNWSTPYAMASLLDIFYKRKNLSAKSSDLLMRLLVESSNSDNRLKGQLPDSMVVAHKTGTSGTNAEGMMAAVNDAGIITLPNGKHIALVVFITDTKAEFEDSEKLIAQIAKASVDYFSKR